MADLGLTNSPLMRDLYNTPEQAVFAAAQMGLTGYRTYNINGETKYVPGATYLEYEKAVRLVKVQGKIVARGDDDFGGKLVGLQFANSKTEIQGDPMFTMGNFSITTAASRAEGAEVVNNDATQSFTGQKITDAVNENAPYEGALLLEDVVTRIDENLRVEVVFDRRKLENYVMFSSLKERIKQAIQEVVLGFPGALHFRPVTINNPTVKLCDQHTADNLTQLTLDTITMVNPLSLDYLKDTILKEYADGVSPLRNFAKTYDQYVLYYNGVEYPILNAQMPTAAGSEMKIMVQGLPFEQILTPSKSLNVDFYIKPSTKAYEVFYESLSDLAAFLMNVDGEKGDYTAEVFVPTETEGGQVVQQLTVVKFPMMDRFNIDITTDHFDQYLQVLNDIADDFDRYKTNLIARFLTTESLQEFDTEDRRFNIIMQVYGRVFDQVKQYIDGLSFIRKADYSKMESLPDALQKNFARMLGLKTFEIQDEDTLIRSLFDFNESEVEGDLTPAELDMEIWRRLLVNAFYLFQAKGTRKSIEFVMEMIGIPEPIIEINEYIYLADDKLDMAQTQNALFGQTVGVDGTLLYPFDADGFPTTPKDTHFQANGGYLRLDDQNKGPYDFGKAYIKKFEKFEEGVFGFDMNRTIDNKKSWVEGSEQYRENYQDLRHTFYYEKDSRLAVNSKELEAYIALDRIFDIYHYRHFRRNGIKVGNVDASKLTFDQYLAQVVNDSINVRNRKTIQSYPTLSKIYYDYRKSLGTSENYIDFRKSMEFINKFDTYWVKFVEQFIPATSIVSAGKKIDNSTLQPNKYKYRHGKNTDVQWKGTDGSEYQNPALRPVNWGVVQGAEVTGKNGQKYNSTLEVFNVKGTAGNKYTGYDTTVNDYFAVEYSIEDFCENEPFVSVWDKNEEYSIKIPAGAMREVGHFVIYDDRLYRLRSDVVGGTKGILPSTGTTMYTLIDDYMNAKDITFPDVPTPTSAVRSQWIKSIGYAIAYKMLDAAFDCPPPRPHVCYYDFSGATITVTGTTGTTMNAYVDDMGANRYIRQPRYYGYSKNFYPGDRPEDAKYGKSGLWTTDYRKLKPWVTGTTYYEGEIVTDNNTNYMVMLDLTADTPSPTTGVTTTTIRPGLYEKYAERTVADPFMHVQPAYLKVFVNDPVAEKLSINLTKELGLWHIFSGFTENVRVTDNIINDQIFISDSVTVELEEGGLYPTEPDGLGPVYTVDTDESLRNTISNMVILRPDTMNYVDLRAFISGYETIEPTFVLTEETPGYYLVNNTAFLTFVFDLCFASDFQSEQEVVVYLVNANNKVMNEEKFRFTGSDTVQNRMMKFISQSVFLANERLYLAIKPTGKECRLVRFETVNYSFNEGSSTYFEMDDARMRLSFNGGRSVGNGQYYDPVISVAPIANTFGVITSGYTAEDDTEYNVKHPWAINRHQRRNRYYNQAEFVKDTTSDFMLNSLLGPYYRKLQTNVRTAYTNVKDRNNLDKELPYNKFSFEVRFQTRKVNTSTDLNSALLQGDMISTGVTFYDYFLGNTVIDHENATPSKNIVIGKEAQRRAVGYNTTMPIIGTIYGLTSGVGDYETLNHQTKDNYYSTNYVKRGDDSFVTANGNQVYDLDKPVPPKDVRESEIYKTILASVERFDKRIVNYQLNDVVKVYDDTIKMDVLYVCVRDVEPYHYDKDGIKAKFGIGGDMSLFVEASKYLPQNFEIGGYRDSAVPFATKTKIREYVDNDIVVTISQGATTYTINSLKVGEIVAVETTGGTRYHKLVYNKDLTYSKDKNYVVGDYILYDGAFFICTADYYGTAIPDANKKVTPATGGTGQNFTIINPLTATDWTKEKLTLTADPYVSIYYNAAELPDVPQIVDGDSSYKNLWERDRLYAVRSKRYNGAPFTAYGYQPASGATPPTSSYPNIDKYQLSLAGNLSSIKSGTYPFKETNGWTMYHDYDGYNSYMPLFEVVEYVKDAPEEYSNTRVYNQNSDVSDAEVVKKRKMGDTKMVFRNKVYSLNTPGTPWTANGDAGNPLASGAWDSKDFMTIERMTFYKERTSVKVYGGKVVSMTDDMKDSFHIFKAKDGALTLQTGFLPTAFSGVTYNDRLENGLNMWVDVRDKDRRNVDRYGDYAIRRDQNDIILDYFFKKDSIGNLPVTGEFVGKLKISNPCGHSASVVLGLLLTNSQGGLDAIKPKEAETVKLETPVSVTPYNIRLLINQTGRASGTLTWSGAASGQAVIEEGTMYDQVLTVQPDKEITFTMSYSIANRKTRFDYAYLDETQLFATALNTDLLKTEVSYNDDLRVETRTITLKSTKQNHVLRLGLKGIEKPFLEKDLPFNNIIDIDNITRRFIPGTDNLQDFN